MTVEVVPYSSEWPAAFDSVAQSLSDALADVPVVSIEHVGSTAVPGLAEKPIIDVDIIVERRDVAPTIGALGTIGYVHLGDLGLVDREAFRPPAGGPRRNVYVCVAGTLHVRNHIAIRDALRTRADLRDRYAEVKLALSLDPTMDIPRYLDGKSAVLQEVLAESDLTDLEKLEVLRLNSLDN